MNGGQAFRVPLCNLSDRALLGLLDEAPAGIHCPHCWVGWEPPTAEEAEEHAGCAAANPEPPPGAVGTPMVEATRRLALGALAGTAVLGLLAGVLFSPDLAAAEPDDLADRLSGLDGRVDSLRLEVRALSSAVAGWDRAPVELIVTLPSPTLGPPVPSPLPSPVPSPDDRQGETIVVTPTAPPAPRPVVVIVPDAPDPPPAVTPTPRPEASPTPCLRPGKPKSGKDPCGWPAN